MGCYNDHGIYNSDMGMTAFPQKILDGVSLERCAQEARSRRFPVFSLRSRGECFVGSMGDVALLNRESRKTDDTACSFLPCAINSDSCPIGILSVFFFTCI